MKEKGLPPTTKITRGFPSKPEVGFLEVLPLSVEFEAVFGFVSIVDKEGKLEIKSKQKFGQLLFKTFFFWIKKGENLGQWPMIRWQFTV